jgi:hypothetical protein
MRSNRLILMLGLALPSLSSCGDIRAVAAPSCEVGATQPCTCDDGAAGNQECLATAAEPTFGVCTCAPPAGACEPLATPCDDGDPCTTGDGCSVDGVCAGVPVDCADDRECTVDACRADSGDCYHDDAACPVGPCVTPTGCDDGNPCTEDTCDDATGTCAYQPAAGTLCDDSDACTANDTCLDGACAGTLVDCGDDQPCTVDVCIAGSCEHDASACGTP